MFLDSNQRRDFRTRENSFRCFDNSTRKTAKEIAKKVAVVKFRVNDGMNNGRRWPSRHCTDWLFKTKIMTDIVHE